MDITIRITAYHYIDNHQYISISTREANIP